uniref:ATP synthase F0 subunit 8 n=1 Tax=Leptomyrmex pallens TaxID=611136 RepID=V5JF03_9HYME|nr:ATP synthase F0 subunit 8 [Leptomyrmex pallens]AGL61394.1 ATP synthase F0 subunit 8 [Leptomyrmex pallens]
MPQMMPMMWALILAMTTLTLMLMISFTYFFKLPHLYPNKLLKLTNWNWKW